MVKKFLCALMGSLLCGFMVFSWQAEAQSKQKQAISDTMKIPANINYLLIDGRVFEIKRIVQLKEIDPASRWFLPQGFITPSFDTVPLWINPKYYKDSTW